jgi:hypothetical protein
MVRRPEHPNKEIEAAVQYAEGLGWRVKMLGHWGRIFCPHANRDGCQFGVNGTPRNPEAHARQVIRAVDRCPHKEEETGK